MAALKTFSVTFGGWYQRTTLHLSEIYDLFALGRSQLNLSPKKVSLFHKSLNLKSVTRCAGFLEYVDAVTNDGINIRYYEDGLYLLQTESSDFTAAKDQLTKYFEFFFNPAINYIFSLGAPTPKILANLKTSHPTVILDTHHQLSTSDINEKLGDVYSEIKSGKVAVYKTPQYIVVSAAQDFPSLDLIEMQIFFREFKDQLERYLNIHRQIWEEISVIKERRFLRGNEIEAIRSTLDSYQKTISLINYRIAQMRTYINTRASISRQLQLDEHLDRLFQYKFETLVNTHAYIQDIWKMTSDYLSTAIQVVVEIKNQSTANGINSLRIITTIGVISGIFGYLSRDVFPSITFIGIWYFIILMAITWGINQVISFIYQRRRYEIKLNRNQLND